MANVERATRGLVKWGFATNVASKGMTKDWPKGFSVCFHRNQSGHRKAEFPQLTQRLVQASAPTTLCTIHMQPVKAETPRASGRAFQLTAKEVCTRPDVMVGMYYPYSCYLEICLCL